MEFKTLFIDSPTIKKKGTLGITVDEVIGDQLARDVTAAILEKTMQGYDLFQSMPIQSVKIYSGSYPYSFTSGVLLIFKQRIEQKLPTE